MKALGHYCGFHFPVPNWKQEKQAAICNELHCITYSRKELHGSLSAVVVAMASMACPHDVVASRSLFLPSMTLELVRTSPAESRATPTIPGYSSISLGSSRAVFLRSSPHVERSESKPSLNFIWKFPTMGGTLIKTLIYYNPFYWDLQKSTPNFGKPLKPQTLNPKP